MSSMGFEEVRSRIFRRNSISLAPEWAGQKFSPEVRSDSGHEGEKDHSEPVQLDDLHLGRYKKSSPRRPAV